VNEKKYLLFLMKFGSWKSPFRGLSYSR
jgi:hypothetical protein